MTSSYPWTRIAPQPPQGSDLPIDNDTLLLEHQNSQTVISDLMEKLDEQTILNQKQNEIIESQQKSIQELQSVSSQTFDKLNRQNEHLKQEIDKLNILKQEIQVQKENEFVYPIIVQAIISQKAGLIGDAKLKRTTFGTLRWMQQRANVIQYLRSRNLFPQISKYLEQMLMIDETQLMAQIHNLIV
jgi:hypothetical protein